ncbi:MAG TPA: DUF3025 domain-containing protein [Kofleriaceae bacterium]|nr:DUF3025 domain-containing protein [Kofleriaceae bacterium]
MADRSSVWDPARLRHRRFARIADLVARLAHEPDWPAIAVLDAQLRPELAQVGMRLVEAPKTRPQLRPDGTIDPATLYEVQIVERGEIPTRPRNAHDLLNALVWAAFPRAKLALSRALADVQRERAAGRAKLPPTRSRAHDRLALIDEGALVCVTGTATASTWIFGHAIYEHAYAGELAVRGIAIDLAVPEIDALAPLAARAAVDHALATAELARVVRAGPGIAVD